MTLHCRVGLNTKQLATLSIQMAESRRTQSNLQSDSFMAFAYKALLVVKDANGVPAKLKVLSDAGVRFNGTAINRSMMYGILLFGDKVTPAASQALRDIERAFGKDVLTGSYVKLSRLCQVCSTLSGGLNDASEHLVTYVCEFLSWALRFEFIEPKNVTVEGLDKCRDGTVGLVHSCLAKKHILNVLQCWVEDCKKVESAAALAEEHQKLLELFMSYAKFEETFEMEACLSGDGNANDGESQAAGKQESPAAPQEDKGAVPVDMLKKKLKNKIAHAIIDWCYDLMTLTFDAPITKTLSEKTVFKDIVWTEVEGLNGLREISRMLNLHKTVIDTRSNGPPAEDRRQLQRWSSDSNGDSEEQSEMRKERAQAWQQAVVARKNSCMCRF